MKSPGFIYAIGFLIAAILFGWWGFEALPGDQLNIKLGSESVSWPTTTASITDSYIDVKQGSRNRVCYVPKVKYSFKVDREQRTGSQISFSRSMEHSSFDREVTEAMLEHYPSKSTHTVFYSPTDNSKAVLVPGFTIPEAPLPSVMCFLMAASFVVDIFLSILLLSRPTKLNQIIFSLTVLGGAFLSFFGSVALQGDYLRSKVPADSILKVDTDGFYLGGKKFDY